MAYLVSTIPADPHECHLHASVHGTDTDVAAISCPLIVDTIDLLIHSAVQRRRMVATINTSNAVDGVGGSVLLRCGFVGIESPSILAPLDASVF